MNNKNSGGTMNAMKTAIQFAKSLVAAIAGNWLEAVKSVLQSNAGKYIICFVLILALILTSLVPALIGSLVGGLIDLVSDVLDVVGSAFGWVSSTLGGLFSSGEASLEERTDIGYMQFALTGTPWETEYTDAVNVEDMTFTEAVNAVTSASADVIDGYIAQRCGDYVALADSIASSYSARMVRYDGVLYQTCKTSVRVNTMAVPANTGKKIMCAYLAQTNSYEGILTPTLCEWLGQRSFSGTKTVTIDNHSYSIPAYIGKFTPTYQYDEFLQGGSVSGLTSLIDEIVYINSVEKYYYVTYETVPDETSDGTEATEVETETGNKPEMRPVLNCLITVTIGVRSMDEIVYDTIGLWTGRENNYDATTGLNTCEYSGDLSLQDRNQLKYQWVGSDGKTYTRQTYNQMYYYDLYTKVYELFSPNTSKGGDGSSIVAAAQKECELYAQNTTMSGGDKYWSWYYGSQVSPHHPEPWCVCFVYWCAAQCGFISDSGCFGPTVYVNCRDVWEDFKARGQTHTESDFIPQPGDLVLFGSASCLEHIGIVESYNTEAQTLTTLEGNVGDSATGRYNGSGYRIAARRTYTDGVYGTAWAGTNIYGYIRPAYPSNYFRDMVFMKYEASDNPAAIGYDEGGGWSFGLVQFNSNDEVIDGFLQYLQGHYPEMFAAYFGTLPYESGACKTWADEDIEKLKTAWVNCANTEGEKFVMAQLEYAAIIVQPFFDLVQKNYGFDMKRSRALLEMSWCRSIQSGPYGAFSLFKEAFNEKSLETMSDTEIINTFYDKCEQKIPSMKWRLQNERRDVLAFVEETD